MQASSGTGLRERPGIAAGGRATEAELPKPVGALTLSSVPQMVALEPQDVCPAGFLSVLLQWGLCLLCPILPVRMGSAYPLPLYIRISILD